MRVDKNETLHQVAVSTNIDSTILSKIERGYRLPTADQVMMLSKHFKLSYDELQARLVAERIIKDYGLSKTTHDAIQIVQEELTGYQKKLK